MNKTLAALLLAGTLAVGCASVDDKVNDNSADKTETVSKTKKDDDTSKEPRYNPAILILYSGGRITDVYKFENFKDFRVNGTDIYDRGTHSFLFGDTWGNIITGCAESKYIELADIRSGLWDQYVEYHSELDSRPYQQVRDSVRFYNNLFK